MNEMFSEKARKVIEYARDEATRLRHDYIGTEHLLLGIIRVGEGRAVEILTNIGIDLSELKQSIEDVVRRYDAFLLRNHGVMTVGADVVGAYHKLETVEHFAKITFIARHLGRINPLGDEEVQKLMEVREQLGIKGPTPACQQCGACEPVGGVGDPDLQKLIVEEVLKALKGR